MEELKARLEELTAKLTSTVSNHEQRIQALERDKTCIDQLLAERAASRSCLHRVIQKAQTRQFHVCKSCQGQERETA